MIDIVFEFFGVLGLVEPQTLGELIPYIIKIFVGVTLAGMVYGAVADIAKHFGAWRWVG